MNWLNLKQILIGEPKFRERQIKEAIFVKLITDWSQATSLPQELRIKLYQDCPLLIKAATIASKKKDVIKARITLDDGLKIESVLMKHKDGRNTVCVSSQVGCALGCLFCATGKMGFKRNLSSEEIVDQVLFFARLLKTGQKRVDNIVFMGMGEPFLNYEQVMESIRILNDKEGLNIGARHISISTAGVIEGIGKLANEDLQVNLAISLHGPNNRLRSKLIPVNKKYPLEVIFEAVDEYIGITGRKVMFEYLLLNEINDGIQEAVELVKLLNKPLYFLNLITYNLTGAFLPSSSERRENFIKILEKAKMRFSQRHSFGQEIKSGCGQLVIE